MSHANKQGQGSSKRKRQKTSSKKQRQRSANSSASPQTAPLTNDTKRKRKSKKKKNKNQKRKRNEPPAGYKRKKPFESDYNDEFEAVGLNGVLWDPFWCCGASERHLNTLGFNNVVHECEDFYERKQNPPEYSALVTNPPYSGEHKHNIVRYCLESGRPFALLMPDYIRHKHWFTQLQSQHRASTPIEVLAPEQPYHFAHPEGTGKELPPFNGVWFVGGMKVYGPNYFRDQAKKKRPNPRQRKKMRQRAAQAQAQAKSKGMPG